MQNALVTAIKHLDVKGKEQYYLNISTNKGDYMLNVGKKTYETVTELTNKTKLDDPDLFTTNEG